MICKKHIKQQRMALNRELAVSALAMPELDTIDDLTRGLNRIWVELGPGNYRCTLAEDEGRHTLLVWPQTWSWCSPPSSPFWPTSGNAITTGDATVTIDGVSHFSSPSSEADSSATTSQDD